MMKNILDRAERKLSVVNTFFMKSGRPRMPVEDIGLDMSFTGSDPLSDMIDSGKEVFRNFDAFTSVLVKISLNSSNPYPASTSKKMLESVVCCLGDMGVKKICIADSSGLMNLPTRKVMRKKDFSFLKKYGIKLSVFDYGPWINIPINGVYFKNIILSNSIHGYDRIINLSNLKSHQRAGFTSATKSLVGFMHPGQRRILHGDHLVERIAELSLAVKPDLNIIDGRKIFVDGGPDEGRVAEADTILINSSLMNGDLKSYKLLVKKQEENGINILGPDPYKSAYFTHYVKIKDMQI